MMTLKEYLDKIVDNYLSITINVLNEESEFGEKYVIEPHTIVSPKIPDAVMGKMVGMVVLYYTGLSICVW